MILAVTWDKDELLIPGTGFNKNRDKVFFFVGYDYQHQVVDPGTTLSVVPTLAQRQGISERTLFRKLAEAGIARQ